MSCFSTVHIAGRLAGNTILINTKVLRKIQSIVHLLVDAIAGNCIGVRNEDLGDMGLHGQCLAERFHRDSGFGDLVSVESEHSAR
jgi:hypothetical protein